MIGPFLIDKLGVDDFTADLVEKMKNELESTRCSQVIELILDCWVAMAFSNAICFSLYVDDYRKVDKALYDLGRVLMQVRIMFLYSYYFIYLPLFLKLLSGFSSSIQNTTKFPCFAAPWSACTMVWNLEECVGILQGDEAQDL
jgi:hypothetical protein